MLHSPNIPQIGVAYFPVSSRRQRMARRRLYVVAVLAGLALTSGVVGMLTASHTPASAPATYVPIQ